jgi:glucokinase
MPTTRPIVGIDLGGTNMQIGVVSADAKVLGKSKKKTKADEGRDAVLDRIVEGIGEACKESGIKVSDLAATGIGAPGAIDPNQGMVLEAVNLRWDNVPLAKLLKERLGVPVFVDNDVNVAVYGENRLGAGDNSRDLLGVWAGTGIGGGLILNGSLYYGSNWTAGEIGHMIAMPGNQPGTRSLEHNCSRSSVVERITRLIRANRKSVIPSLTDGDLTDIKSKIVAKAYESGDELTVEVVDAAADLLGTCIAGVVTLLSLNRVVLGGGLTEALGEPFVDRVKKAARRHAFPERCRNVKVVMTKLLDEAGVLGAALIAAERLEGRTP